MFEIFLIAEGVAFVVGFLYGALGRPFIGNSFIRPRVVSGVLVGMLFVFIYVSLPVVIYLEYRDRKAARGGYGV